MPDGQDPISATLERSLERFASHFGVRPDETTAMNTKKDPREAVMPANTKTAAENAENDMKGSPLASGVDRGDYESQAEQVNKQKTETAGAAPDGEDERGAKNDTVNYDEKSYSQNGTGGTAKLSNRRAIAAVIAISEKDPKAAARLVHALGEEGTGEGAPSASTDKGEPVGGKPDSVAAGEEAVEGDAAAVEATPPVAAVPQDDVTTTKLQESINDKQQGIDIEKQVVNELTKVLDDATGGTTAKRRTAEDKKDKKDKKEEDKKDKKEEDKKGASKKTAEDDKGLESADDFTLDLQESYSSHDFADEYFSDDAVAQFTELHADEYNPRDVWEDIWTKFWENYQQSNPQKNARKRYPVKMGGGGTGDQTKTKKDEQGAGKVPYASNDPDDHPQKDGDPDKTGAEQAKGQSEKVGDSNSGQIFADSSDKDYKHAMKGLGEALVRGKRVLSAKIASLTKEGKSHKEAIEIVAKTDLGRKMAAAVKRYSELKKQAAGDATGKDVGGNVPPDEQKSDKGDDTTRYESKEQGDTSDDDIAAGTDDKKESPETGKVVDQARGELSSKHNSDVAGSTVAFKLSVEQRTRIAQDATKLAKASEVLGKIYEGMSSVTATKTGGEALVAVGQRTVAAMKKVFASVEEIFKKDTVTAQERSRLGLLVREGQTLVNAAKDQAVLLRAMTVEAQNARARFARVSPSFKLAVQMVQAGTINMHDLPSQVAEFIGMSSEQFSVAEKMAMKVASSKPARRVTAGVQRLPHIATASGLAQHDELDGVFDE